jgi:flagellar biogenesis protein FliO
MTCASMSRVASRIASQTGSQRPAIGALLLGWWQRLVQLGRRPPKRLRLCESLPLGEHRFVAVIEFEQARFLVGGTPASLMLLARLENGAEMGPRLANEPADFSREPSR